MVVGPVCKKDEMVIITSSYIYGRTRTYEYEVTSTSNIYLFIVRTGGTVQYETTDHLRRLHKDVWENQRSEEGDDLIDRAIVGSGLGMHVW